MSCFSRRTKGSVKLLSEFENIISDEIAKIKAISELPEDEQNKQRNIFHRHFDELPTPVKTIIYCEYCKTFPDYATSGFHELLDSQYAPISFLGWADYEYMPSKDHCFVHQGVAFRINRDSFIGREIELYYTDDDMLGEISDYRFERLKEMLEKIKSCSSGLRDIRIHREKEERDFMFHGRMHEACMLTSFRFFLDSSKIKDSVSINGAEIPSSELGGYVFVLPKAGEFFCELGEIVNGRRIPLLVDDYCIK